ncbi:MAG: oligopeptide transporter, OPT family [Planctomycetes bacterium]|nr:oligopeptide transporter, OPT family [Planctomycetota bacterium]
MAAGLPSFHPHVPPSESPPELTLRSLVLGAVLGVVFGAASTYLALRVGLTVSASVPIAVIAIALLKRRAGQRAILEHNITQTVGSAGESVAAAVVFTVPALIFLGYPLEVGLATLIALTGGGLGVLLMVPLRRYLIVKEHGVLRYPEGRACAEILMAGEKGGTSARKVFVGMAAGAGFKALQALLGAVKLSAGAGLNFYKGASVACDFEPPLLGVGYILGYRTSVMMVSGSFLASFVLVPLVLFFGAGLSQPLPPGTDLISSMTGKAVWESYVKHIGAGAVAAGGILGLLRALPAIVSSLRASTASLLGGGAGAASGLRTDRDAPLGLLVLGVLGIVAFIALWPAFHMNLLGAALIVFLGFLFAVVSSRITGEVGSTSCPLSGMTIGVLMATCGAFLLAGWEGSAYARLALMVGAVVCVAISNAGTCSQDLKTGHLVGSTPVRQQGALLIGVLTSVLAVGWTAYLLNLTETRETPVEAAHRVAPQVLERGGDAASREDGKVYRFVRLSAEDAPPGMGVGNYLVDEATDEVRYRRDDGIGSGRLQAPQAKLMSVVIDGLLTRTLPWDLILVGVAIALFVELLGFRSLTFAVGVYLPLASTLPVFLGGLVRRLADRRYGRAPDADDEPEGTLYCSGLIAGASILAILATLLAFDTKRFDADNGYHKTVAVLSGLSGWLDATLGTVKGLVSFAPSDVLFFLVLGALGLLIFRAARGAGGRSAP